MADEDMDRNVNVTPPIVTPFVVNSPTFCDLFFNIRLPGEGQDAFKEERS